MAEQARFSLARTIHTFQNPWTRRHAPEAPAAPSQWDGAGAVNPHRISVSQIDAGGTSHILNAAARSKAVPRPGAHFGSAGGAVSPIVGEHGGQGGSGSYQGKHRGPAKRAPMKKVVEGTRVQREYNQQPAGDLGHSERTAVTGNMATNQNHPLTAGIQHAALGRGAQTALPVGSYRSASGSAPEWSGTAQPRSMPERQYRSAAGGPRVIQGSVERVNDAIPMPRAPGAVTGAAPDWGATAKVVTPPNYVKAQRPYSPSAGGTPMHRRKTKAAPAEQAAAAPEPAAAAPVKATRTRRTQTAKAAVETPAAPPTEAKPKATRKRATKAQAVPATQAVESTPAKPAIAAPPRAQRQPTAKEPVHQPAQMYKSGHAALAEDAMRNAVARERLHRQVEAAPAETRFANPGVGQGRRKRAEEANINFQNNRAMAARAVGGGYRPAGSPDEAAQRRAAARKKLGIPDDVD